MKSKLTILMLLFSMSLFAQTEMRLYNTCITEDKDTTETEAKYLFLISEEKDGTNFLILENNRVVMDKTYVLYKYVTQMENVSVYKLDRSFYIYVYDDKIITHDYFYRTFNTFLNK